MESRWILVFRDQMEINPMGINQMGSNRQFSNFTLLESNGIGWKFYSQMESNLLNPPLELSIFTCDPIRLVHEFHLFPVGKTSITNSRIISTYRISCWGHFHILFGRCIILYLEHNIPKMKYGKGKNLVWIWHFWSVPTDLVDFPWIFIHGTCFNQIAQLKSLVNCLKLGRTVRVWIPVSSEGPLVGRIKRIIEHFGFNGIPWKSLNSQNSMEWDKHTCFRYNIQIYIHIYIYVYIYPYYRIWYIYMMYSNMYYIWLLYIYIYDT